MFFTQEDYKKIEQWLKNSSIKDSDFKETEDIKDTDTIVIVQDGSNKKIKLKFFTEQLLDTGSSDFINVTNKYKDVLSLQDAIIKIPTKSRKEGLVITFKNITGDWEIHQFIGHINQWNFIDQWKKI